MRRAAVILGAVLLAGIAQAQVPPPSADAAWSSVVLVVGGVVALAGLVVAVGAAWRTLTRPWERIQEDITALRRQVEALGVKVESLEQFVRSPPVGVPSLLGRLEAVEAVVAEHLADRERREDARDRLLQEVHLALREFRRTNGLDSNGS